MFQSGGSVGDKISTEESTEESLLLRCGKVGQAGSCIPTRETVGSRLGDLASFGDHKVSNISIGPFEGQTIEPVCPLH